MEEIKDLVVIITGIVGIIGGMSAAYGKYEKNYIKYMDIYYEKVVEPIILSLATDKEFSLEQGINKYIKEYYHYIPTYIIYMIHLINNKSHCYKWEDIEKVLIVDYLKLRPSKNNIINKFFEGASRYIEPIEVFFRFLVIVISFIMCGVFLIASIRAVLQKKGIEYILLFIVIMCIFIFLILLMIKTEQFTDKIYSSDIKEIKENISKSIAYYNKLYLEYGADANEYSKLLFLKIEGD